MQTAVRRKHLLWLLAAAGLMVFLFWQREPKFEGRRLSAWLQDLVLLDLRHSPELAPAAKSNDVRREKAVRAVRAIGPRAVPQLLRWLRSGPAPPSPIHDKLEELVGPQTRFNLPLSPMRADWDQALLAITGFEVLGPSAKAAVPDLGWLLLDPVLASSAARCLCAVGPAAFPAFTRALTNPEPAVLDAALDGLMELRVPHRSQLLTVLTNAIAMNPPGFGQEAVPRLGDLGSAARDVTPWLDSLMRDSTNPLAGPAMRVMAEIAIDPTLYVPFFGASLLKTNLAPDAAFALARVGSAGVPSLLSGLTNQNRLVKTAAIAALNPKFRRTPPAAAAYRFSFLSQMFTPYCRITAHSKQPPGLRDRAIAFTLSRALEHPDPAVRLQIVQLLGNYGSHGASGLSRATHDQDAAVRHAAEAALASLPVRVLDGAIVRGPLDRKAVALVFTGHEFAEGGEVILDALSRHKAQAAFFLTGDFLNNQAFGPLIQRIANEGHYLGPHSDKHLLYCPWQGPKTNLVSHQEFDIDFSRNLSKIQHFTTPGLAESYFIPPYEHYNLEIVEWAVEFDFVTINYTPGTRSPADYTGEADRNFVSSQAIFDSILAREQQDPHGLNGFILLLHIGAGPGRADKFHSRFGELLDALAAKGYQFVALDELFDPEGAQDRRKRFGADGTAQSLREFRARYGLPPAEILHQTKPR